MRDDWNWPERPAHWSASDEEVRGVSQFRERYYATSASDNEPEASGSATDPYKFDSPDSIGDAVGHKSRKRKQKRRAAQEEEMGWNEGLREFVERRDVWTGAASVVKYKDRIPLAETASGSSIPPPEASSAQNDPADPLVPLAPPMLPGNPIRTSIRPSGYIDIYNNIVVIGRSPSVPVNLSDMTRALVVGWKETGEWPPKPGPLDPLAGRKRAAAGGGLKLENGEGPFLAHHPHVKKGVDSVKRILHIDGPHHAGKTNHIAP